MASDRAPHFIYSHGFGNLGCRRFFFHPPFVETSNEFDRARRSDGAVGNRRLREGGPEVSPDG
ncbi:MAG: hypothetical protein JRF45_16125 [Deltaproteobacteria bacterium]|nr:hypothetical protein [Deltaproteobacteria bacterium]